MLPRRREPCRFPQRGEGCWKPGSGTCTSTGQDQPLSPPHHQEVLTQQSRSPGPPPLADISHSSTLPSTAGSSFLLPSSNRKLPRTSQGCEHLTPGAATILRLPSWVQAHARQPPPSPNPVALPPLHRGSEPAPAPYTAQSLQQLQLNRNPACSQLWHKYTSTSVPGRDIPG